jgi:hypothetical protein
VLDAFGQLGVQFAGAVHAAALAVPSAIRSSALHIALERGTETEKRIPRARQSASRSIRQKPLSKRPLTTPCPSGR